MWWWLLGWCVLVLLGIGFLALVCWGLVKRIMELGRAFARSADRLAPALEQISDSYTPARSVLSDPTAPPAAPRRRRGAGHRRAVGHRRRWGVG
jgi:CHASE1-domain containing sensor protein